MSNLSRVTGREVVKALAKFGYEEDRQRGSHRVLRQKVYPHRRIGVLTTKKSQRETLRSIIRHAGLTVDEIKSLL